MKTDRMFWLESDPRPKQNQLEKSLIIQQLINSKLYRTSKKGNV